MSNPIIPRSKADCRDPGFAHTRDVQMNASQTLTPQMGVNQMIHQGLLEDIKNAIIQTASLAEDTAKFDEEAAINLYEAVYKLSQVAAQLKSEKVIKEIVAQDSARRKEYGDYWRGNSGRVSRY